MAVNYDAHGLKAYYHDCVMTEEDRIDKHGEPMNYVYDVCSKCADKLANGEISISTDLSVDRSFTGANG